VHFFYNKVEFTPSTGLQTNDTSVFFKFGSWAQSRAHPNDPAGSVDQAWTYSASVSHTATAGGNTGSQQIIPDIPGVTSDKSAGLVNSVGLFTIAIVCLFQLLIN